MCCEIAPASDRRTAGAISFTAVATPPDSTPSWRSEMSALAELRRCLLMAAVLTAAGPAPDALRADDATGVDPRTPGPGERIPSSPRGVASFDTDFAGVSADGAWLLWEGRVAGPDGAVLTLALKPLLSPQGSGESVWPVQVRWTVLAPGGAAVQTADVSGLVDWKRRELHLNGFVTGGTDAGMQLTVTARVDDLEPVGTFRLLSTTAAR